MIDFSRCRIPPYDHQRIGILRLLQEPIFFIADEMGLGKTKTIIDTGQFLFHDNIIDRVLVLTPAPVRGVWYDPDLGELRKHLWADTPAIVMEFHSTSRTWISGPSEARRFEWRITNYDYIRTHVKELLAFCGPRTWLVCDESSYVKNYKAKQTKATKILRQACGRVTLLNGTPISNNPLDMYSQGEIMHPDILGCKSIIHARSRYAIVKSMHTFTGVFPKIIGWQNLEDLERRFAPYVLRRLKSDCLKDLPPKIPPVTITSTLEPATWKMYSEMKEDFVSWLDASSASTAAQAVVKVMRLSQITSGFLGGVVSIEADGEPDPQVKEVGREKLNTFLEWYADQFEENPNLKMIVWCRWRFELSRLVYAILQKYGRSIAVGELHGQQPAPDRQHALTLLDPRSSPKGPVLVAGTPSTGRVGLNLAAAHIVVYLSNDYSLFTRLQSEDRCHRPGQVNPVSYFDFVAVGPRGQHTIDHGVVKALRDKFDLASATTEAWRKVV